MCTVIIKEKQNLLNPREIGCTDLGFQVSDISVCSGHIRLLMLHAIIQIHVVANITYV